MRKTPGPGLAAKRAVHEYRRRDVVPYLALRYYLESTSARRDDWAIEAASDLVLRRRKHVYYESKHFKGRDEAGVIQHRVLFLPGPGEALAEAQLLSECAKYVDFSNSEVVYSYELSAPGQAGGAYVPYYPGLLRRQQAIAAACKGAEGQVVQYLDIKRFYPSVRLSLAARAWGGVCASSGIESRWKRVGERLIEGYASLNKRQDPTLLTGPLFSHLLASLVLGQVDRAMQRLPVKYFRYVDDVVLVGRSTDVGTAEEEIRSMLQGLGLSMHPPGTDKSVVVHARDWLSGEHDLREDPEPVQWKTLVGGLKWLLISAPDSHEQVQGAFRSEGYRMPLLDYSSAIREKTYLERLSRYVRTAWFRKRRRGLKELLAETAILRRRYVGELSRLLDDVSVASGYARKRLVPRARYLAGRLAYLGRREELGTLEERMRSIPELEFHATVFGAIATRDVTEPLRLGSNVVQAVAQALRAEGVTAHVQGPVTSSVEVEGLAVLAMNGVRTVGAGWGEWEREPLVKVARDGVQMEELRCEDTYMRELASLHGLGSPRHEHVLESAFDASDAPTFDAVSAQIYGS